MTLINFFKWFGGGVIVLIALLCLFLQGTYWYGASFLPNELPQPRNSYPAPARAALWQMLDGGETALSVRKLNAFSELEIVSEFTARYMLAPKNELPSSPADLNLLDITTRAVRDAIREAHAAQAAPQPQSNGPSNAEALQQASYTYHFESMALDIRISREWPAERMADMVLETRDYGRDSKGLEQAASAYFGSRTRDLAPSELYLLVAIGLQSGQHDPYCHAERFLAAYSDPYDGLRTPSLPPISATSLSRLKPATCKTQP